MRAGNTAFTFLQISDVHLDSKLASTRLRLPASKRAAHNHEILQSLLKGFRFAKENRLDAVVIPGDLWDSESISSRTLHELIEGATELDPIPLIVAPGNHDYCSTDSFYTGGSLRTRGMRDWPSNAHIFSSAEFEQFRHPHNRDVVFTGRAFTGNVLTSERLLSSHIPLAEGKTNILLFHGSLDGYSGGDSYLPGKRTAPFSAAELDALGFDYAAIGHYHDHTEIRNRQGKLLGAYSGCLMGRGIDESGAKTASVVTLRQGCEPVVERVEFAQRRIIVASYDISRRPRQQLLSDIEVHLQQAEARPQLDLVYLTLEGKHPVGGEPRFVEEELSGKYYHLVVVDESRPDYILDQIDYRTTEGKFVRSMLALKQQAESAGGLIYDTKYGDLTVTAIDDALYYGMDALKQKKIAIRYVD